MTTPRTAAPPHCNSAGGQLYIKLCLPVIWV